MTSSLATDSETRVVVYMFVCSFQAPFNTVSYSLIGDGVGLTLFKINTASGAITTRTNLQSDNQEQYQVSLHSYSLKHNLDKTSITHVVRRLDLSGN